MQGSHKSCEKNGGNCTKLSSPLNILLNIVEHENFSANRYENANYCWHFHIYKQRKFHAQLI